MANGGEHGAGGTVAGVARGVVEYELGAEPCTGTGIRWTADELDGALAGPVAALLRDDAGSMLVGEALSPLLESGFSITGIEGALALEQGPTGRLIRVGSDGAYSASARRVERATGHGSLTNWRVGEAIAEAYLSHRRGCFFPWPVGRDVRRPGSSLPGADLVGFVRMPDGDRFTFGEVKTSAQDRYPPDVMGGRSGLRRQLEDLRDHVALRDQAVRYLAMRSRDAGWRERFRGAAMRYLRDSRDVRLYGVLVRDAPPGERDLQGAVAELATGCPDATLIALIGLYLPDGRIGSLADDVRSAVRGGEA